MKTVTLKIRESQWSGWARSQPPSTEREVLLPVEGTFTLALNSQRYTCAVTRIEADAVDLAPVGSAPALVNEDGSFGRPMAALSQVGLGQSLKVCTWTLDVGANWEIIVESIQA